MRSFKDKILQDLHETQQQGAIGFEQLWSMLRADRVLFQEQMMRLKRNCKDLYEIDDEFRLDFEKTKPRVEVLQEELFSNQPFSLARNQEFEEEFPQEYFWDCFITIIWRGAN